MPRRADPPPRTVQVQGYDLSVTDAGSGRPAVLLVHGIGVSARYFDLLVAELSRTGRAVAPDLVGFGSSTRRPQVLSIEEHADVMAGLLTTLGIAGAVVLGHSMGAQIATELAVRRPDLVERVVIVGPVVDPDASSRRRQAWRLARDIPHESLSTHEIQLTDWLRAGPRRYAATLQPMMGYPLMDRLRLVERPVTLVRGAKDPVAPLGFLERLATVAPDAAVVEVQGAGHVVMRDRPEVMARLCQSVRL